MKQSPTEIPQVAHPIYGNPKLNNIKSPVLMNSFKSEGMKENLLFTGHKVIYGSLATNCLSWD